MKIARDPVIVLREMTKLIPQDEKTRKSVIDELEQKILNLENSLAFSSPEMLETRRVQCWKGAANIMRKYYPELDTPWKKEMANLFNDTK